MERDYPYSKSSGIVIGPSRAVRAVRWILLGLMLTGLVALYVLSVGPITWLDDRGFLPQPAGTFFVYFYAPLFFASKYLPGLEHLLDWYISLFE